MQEFKWFEWFSWNFGQNSQNVGEIDWIPVRLIKHPWGRGIPLRSFCPCKFKILPPNREAPLLQKYLWKVVVLTKFWQFFFYIGLLYKTSPWLVQNDFSKKKYNQTKSSKFILQYVLVAEY